MKKFIMENQQPRSLLTFQIVRGAPQILQTRSSGAEVWKGLAMGHLFALCLGSKHPVGTSTVCTWELILRGPVEGPAIVSRSGSREKVGGDGNGKLWEKHFKKNQLNLSYDMYSAYS